MRETAILTSVLIHFQLVSTSEAETGKIQSPRSESELYLTQNSGGVDKTIALSLWPTQPPSGWCGKNEQLCDMLLFTFLLGQIQLRCLEST